MNKQEAIALMMKGIKITHRYFSKEEWMTMEGDEIVLEDGVRCSPDMFWFDRQISGWNDGYSIYNGGCQ